VLFLIFFFQAEDGIRAPLVTGVQTCALPIFLLLTRHSLPVSVQLAEDTFKRLCREVSVCRTDGSRFVPRLHDLRHAFAVHRLTEIGRASCRERVWISRGARS